MAEKAQIMIRGAQLLALIMAAAAVYFFWQRNNDAAFITFALGASFFFLSIRFQAKQRLDERAAAREPESEDDEPA